MTRASPLPSPLDRGPFSIASASAAGVARSRLRANDLVIPTRGARALRSEPASIPDDETHSVRLERIHAALLERAAQFAPVLAPTQFFSHETGLALLGAPMPFTEADSRELHISARHPASKPRRAGVVGHRLRERAPSRWHARGLPIDDPARLWRQVGHFWELDDLIAAADFLVLPRRRLITIDALRREIERAGDVAGGILSRALAEVRIGAETHEETVLRLALVRAGLPEPELNVVLRAQDGRFVARLDLAYRRYRVAPEHDGRTHAFNEQQFAKDADRWDDIRAQGWNHVRILSHHLHPDAQPAIDKTTEALFAAGWRPGRA
ncbi:hypothetical protein GCM10022240_09900 [Microbacterium kribbense]|uniref:DUF559 domain-containing protein n=1 Tax=Microbacterium kribbense TaxID=433645 RepID=A0ABP7GAP7_9MICO